MEYAQSQAAAALAAGVRRLRRQERIAGVHAHVLARHKLDTDCIAVAALHSGVYIQFNIFGIQRRIVLAGLESAAIQPDSHPLGDAQAAPASSLLGKRQGTFYCPLDTRKLLQIIAVAFSLLPMHLAL